MCWDLYNFDITYSFFGYDRFKFVMYSISWFDNKAHYCIYSFAVWIYDYREYVEISQDNNLVQWKEKIRTEYQFLSLESIQHAKTQ